LYGPAGSGKTALVSQASGGYLFDFDDGMRTALTLKDKFTEARQKIEFDIYIDDPKKPDAYQRARKKLLDFQTKTPFDAIVVDSLTGLCRAIQLHVLSCSGNLFAQPKIQHFGMMVNELESMLTILRSLKVPVLVTAHELLADVDGSTVVRILSATKSHGANKLAWLFDEVLYCKARRKGQGKKDYIVTGEATESILARTRSGLTKDFVHNDVGLVGLLERIGYIYKPKAENNEDDKRHAAIS